MDETGQVDCAAKTSTNWKSGADMPKSLADHCTLIMQNHKVLVTGGRTLEGFVVKNSFSYDAKTDSWDTLSDMGQARKQHTCTKFNTTTGFEVAIVAGGEGDTQGELLSSCEIFYLDVNIGQWARIHELPISLTMSSMLNINNRLILSGGISEGIVQDAIWVYDQKSGWHFFNQKLHTAMYAHTSTIWKKGNHSLVEGKCTGCGTPNENF